MSVCPNKNDEGWKKLVAKYGEKTAMAAFIRNGQKTPTVSEAEALIRNGGMDGVLAENAAETEALQRMNLDEAMQSRGLQPKGTNEEKAAEIAAYDQEQAGKPMSETVPKEGQNDITKAYDNQNKPELKTVVDSILKNDGADAEAVKMGKEFDAAEKFRADKDRTTWGKAKAFLKKQLFYVEGEFQGLSEKYSNELLKASGKKTMEKFDVARHVGAKAMWAMEGLVKRVYSTVPRSMKPLLDRLIETKRSILIDEQIKSGRIRESAYFKNEGFKLSSNATVDMYKAYQAYLKKTLGPEMYKKLDDASNLVSEELRGYIGKLKEAGMISDALAKYLDEVHTFYSPREIIRLIDPETPMRDADNKPILDSGIKALDAGTEQYLEHDWEMLASNYIGRMETRIAKNMANRSLAQHAEQAKSIGENPLGLELETPLVDEFGNVTGSGKEQLTMALDVNKPSKQPEYQTNAPADMTRVPYWENGVQKNILMPSDVAQDWVLFDPTIQHSMTKILSWITGTNFVKSMATGINPEFGLFNIPRDIQLYTFISDLYSKYTPVAWSQMAKDMAALRPGSKAYLDAETALIKEAGGFELMADYGKDSLIMKILNKHESLRNLSEMLIRFNRISETWTRLALRKRAIDSGMTPQEASNYAIKICDFSTGGKLSKTLDKFAPYFNPGVVVTRNIGEYFMKNPRMAWFKTAQYIAMGMGLAYWNRMLHKDAWESVSDRDKESMWIFTTPITYNDENGVKRHLYFRLPQDQAFRIFSQIGQQISEKSLTGNVDMKQVQTAMQDAIPLSADKMLPPTLKAWLAYTYNQDFWNKVPIWNGRQVPPAQEWTAQTPSLAVLWGKTSGMSPERTSKALSNIFPMNPYTWMLGTIGDATLPDDNKVHKSFSEYLLTLPGARKLIRISAPIELSEQDKSRAKLFKVSTTNPDGTPRPPRVVRGDTQKADILRGGLRQNLDNEQDHLVMGIKLGEHTREELLNWIASQPDNQERTRLRIRLKNKYKKIMNQP